jgi:hypothetical protein
VHAIRQAPIPAAQPAWPLWTEPSRGGSNRSAAISGS